MSTDRFLPPQLGQAKDAVVERVGGVGFEQVGVGQDTARCTLCGQIVDVGGELKAHLREHAALRLETFDER